MTAVAQRIWVENPVRYGSEAPVVRYSIMECISRGAYGVVYRAWDNVKAEEVAIKHEIGGLSQSTKRELAFLKFLPRHRNVVNLKDVVLDSQGVFVVMECFPFDLWSFINAKPKPCSIPEVKRMMRQILQGVAFLHANGVTHRDLKPSNILVDGQGRLKICDFGLARRLQSESGALTPGVVTLWYRSPELLIGTESYSSAIDLWSVGCIMAELTVNEVLFRGESEIDQLSRIQEILESPNPASLRLTIVAAAMGAGVPWLNQSGFDLLEKLLAMDPNSRITAIDALRHDWFKE